MKNPRSALSALFALLLAILFSSHQADASAPDEIRALWIQAWVADLHSPEGIDKVIADARAANINTLLPQVRRRADTLYFSDIEPRASGVQPGFDALQYMIEQAHAQTPPMEVHAWIVVYPIGNSSDPDHTINKNPEWITQTADGQTGAPNYQHDPGHPGVHQHLLDVSMELIEKYDIDGLHFDYVRYNGNQWGYNPVAIERFHRLYGRDDIPASNDPEWSQFRRDQITQTVRRIYLHAAAEKPEVKISAATITWGHNGVSNLDEWWSSSAYAGILQDWRGWMEEGILDLNIPMNYYRHHNNTPPEDHAQAYYNWSHFAKDHKYNRHVAIGPGIYLNTLANAVHQMRHTREPSPSGNFAQGFCGYVYHVTNNQGLPFEEFRKAVTEPSIYDPITPPMLAEPAAIPEMPWKTTPTTGHLMGYVRDAETTEPLDGAWIHLIGPVERTIQTDPHGFYGFVDLPPGTYYVNANWEGGEDYPAEVVVAIGAVARQDLEFETPPPTTGQLRGYVRNAVNQKPAAGATVVINGTTNHETMTTALGFYRFLNLPPGNYTVTATWDESADPAPPTMFSIAVGEVTHQDLHFAVAGGGTPGEEIIVDNEDAEATFIGGDWRIGTAAGGFGTNYHWTHTSSHPEYAGPHLATFSPQLPAAGFYQIDTWYLQGNNRSPDAPYTISDGASEEVVFVNQRANGSQWFTVVDQVYLDPADSPFVSIGNQAEGAVVMADAVRWTLLEPIDPEFSLTTSITGKGRIEGLPEDGIAPHGAILELKAFGENGYVFSHWEGNAWGSTNPISVHVGADLKIRAVFTSPWLDWIAANFSEEEQENGEFTAPGADPLGHGISNLLKFAFGLDVRQPDRSLLPSASVDGEDVVLVFRRRQGDAGLDYLVEISTDLIAWHPDQERMEETATTFHDDGTETVTVRVATEGEQRLFVRLRVEWK